MELSGAKELLKEMKENAMYLRLYHDKKAQLKVEAIDTVLKALDNSIIKDKIINKIEEIDKQGDTSCVRQMAYYFDDRTFVDKEGAIKILKELLGEEII